MDEPRLTAPLRDCWKKVGVQGGDGSCPELVRHVHCRNCPVYGAAAERLLERALPPGQLAHATAHYAQRAPSGASAWQSVVIFRLGAEWLALPTAAIDAVATLRPVHSLPHRQGGLVRGLANVRGELLVCVSLEQLLGTEPSEERGLERDHERHAYPRLLVLRREANRFVARVDEVHGTHRFPLDRLLAPPTTVARAAVRFTTMLLPWGERSVGCLDDARLLAALERSLA